MGRLARNAILGAIWQPLRVLAQAGWVIVVIRVIGAEGFGVLAGTFGLATTLGGLSGLGTGTLMVKYVAIEPASFGRYWRIATRTTIGTGLVLALGFAGVGALAGVGGPAIGLLVSIALSELICLPLVSLCGFAFQAHERLGIGTALTAIGALARLGAALTFAFAEPQAGVYAYAKYHLVAAVAVALICVLLTDRALRRRDTVSVHRPLARSEWLEGLGFSVLWFSSNGLAELDKTLALRFGGGTTAGIYSAAYRFAMVLILPILALVMAAQPRLFRAGAGGGAEQARLLRHLLLAAMAYSLAAIALMQVAAPVIPWLLGAEFAPAAAAARWLVLLVPLYGLRITATTVLTARGRQRTRALCEFGSLAAMYIFAFVLIPRYGLAGCIAMILATEATLAAVAWLALGYGRASPGAAPPTAP